MTRATYQVILGNPLYLVVNHVLHEGVQGGPSSESSMHAVRHPVALVLGVRHGRHVRLGTARGPLVGLLRHDVYEVLADANARAG